jgi:hypothetical protein
VEDLLTGGFRSLAMAMSVANCTGHATRKSVESRGFPRPSSFRGLATVIALTIPVSLFRHSVDGVVQFDVKTFCGVSGQPT